MNELKDRINELERLIKELFKNDEAIVKTLESKGLIDEAK